MKETIEIGIKNLIVSFGTKEQAPWGHDSKKKLTRNPNCHAEGDPLREEREQGGEPRARRGGSRSPGRDPVDGGGNLAS